MKKILIFCVLSVSYCSVASQSVGIDKKNTNQDFAFFSFEHRDAVPPYGLDKVSKLIYEIKGDQYSGTSLDEKTYQSLLLREQFTYHMIHPEQFAQICSMDLSRADRQKAIFAQLPLIFQGFKWSERQWKFFSTNRDSVIAWMDECIRQENKVGLNFKRAIVYLNASKMTPLLIRTYTLGPKDNNLLTVLMLLLKQSKYPPFLASPLYKKLYEAEDASYHSAVDFSFDNELLILSCATDFSKGLGK